MIMFKHFVFTRKYLTLYELRVISWDFVFSVCKWIGFFWLIIEPLSFFSPSIEEFIKGKGWWLFGVSILITLIKRRPRLKFKYFIRDKDVHVNIVIGDLLAMNNKDIVIPTNVHFITEISDKLISENSVQGQFTKKYFTSHAHLDADIVNNLRETKYTDENPPYFGKDKQYPLGTVAKLPIKKNNKTTFWSYLFALAKLNEHGVCQSNIAEFQKTLPLLWDYIQTKGELSDIAMPILGSGFCRIDSSREDLFKEILLSFLAATRNSKFCKSLTIVIYYRDVSETNIDLESIKEFTKYQTLNFSRESAHKKGKGQAIGE
ncbi:macro domain-containing protein [Porphyromonas sp. COT-108 OH1349]|uniref:macro domain-containing protein n=1 Tax=Porphyromonas sp. COT-108 OH1349 TaxID=1537504 RepID=UPI00052BF590|nr:macro domain-containing protein [Porphyromonas sp. COT-108 OH1349]KGN67552.1 hypothetical protein JT26_10130 [Porphyromonas sp. COT-108 OH1349]